MKCVFGSLDNLDHASGRVIDRASTASSFDVAVLNMRDVLYAGVDTSVPRAMGQRKTRALPYLRSAAVLASKVAVSAACFCTLSTNIRWTAFTDGAITINAAWGLFALGLMILQIPLAGIRWGEIVAVLAPGVKGAGRARLLAITSIGVFFGQVVPNLFGETVRVWMLAGHGVDWRTGLSSVLIDRAVGVLAFVAIAFMAFLAPSPLTHVDGYRPDILLILGAVLTVGATSLLLARPMGTILVRHRGTAVLGRCATSAHDALVQSPARASIVFLLALLVHILTIAAIWSLARSEGLALPIEDAAVLFAVIGGAAIIPVVIGGWGLREVGVTALLQFEGVPAEKALALSVSFGALTFLASLPGAVMWFFSPAGSAETC